MTALAPRPTADAPHTAEVDLGEELDGLRRRADDQAALLRKHQTAVTQLADSVAALVALGKKRNRWINLNSFVAYVLFTVLLGGAMLFVYRSRVGELEARHAQAVAERDLARAGGPAAGAAHDGAIAAALREALKAAHAPRAGGGASGTSATRTTPAPSPGEEGIAKFKAGAWADAVAALDRVIAADPDGAGTAQLRYYKGVASWKRGDHRVAADELERALGGSLDAAAHDARYFLAASLDKLGELDRARVEYDRFATQYPKNQYAVFARRRSATLARKARPAAAARKKDKDDAASGSGPAPKPADDTAVPDPFKPAAETEPAPAPTTTTPSSPPPP